MLLATGWRWTTLRNGARTKNRRIDPHGVAGHPGGLRTHIQEEQPASPGTETAAWSHCADTYIDEGGRQTPPTQDNVGRV